MGLNDITLPPQLLADLYSNVLIETNTTVMPEKASVKFLGKNDKNILIVVSNADSVFLPDNELTFLTTILSACKMTLSDVAIVNRSNNTMNSDALMNRFNSNQVLLFSLTPTEFGLPVNFPHFQVQSVNGKTFLAAPSLSEIEEDVKLKKQLWAALKKLFAL